MSGQRLPAERHWSQTGEAGDIKLVWELSRFSVVYALVRAYAAGDDERYPAAFWTLIADWAQRNPPQRGPNWKCGQEAAFRLMAWCFGLYGFASSPHTTPERIASLAAMIAAHADRIAGNIAYARSQKNTTPSARRWACGRWACSSPNSRAPTAGVIRAAACWWRRRAARSTPTALTCSTPPTITACSYTTCYGRCDWARSTARACRTRFTSVFPGRRISSTN